MIGATINLVGAILQCAAQDLPMILVGRILAGWAVGLLSMSVPIYQSECAHPKTRGSYYSLTRHSDILNTDTHRSHRRSCPADDRGRLYRFHLGRLRRV
jgi:hypothetical protein